MRFVALLRGINVGGNKKVPMDRLKSVFEESGFANVRTLLNSGNVLFDANENSASALRKKVSAALEKTFGFTIPTIVVPMELIGKIIASNPFKGVPVNKDARLYVTFLSEKPSASLRKGYASPDKSFRVLSVFDDAAFSVLDVSKAKTPEAMSYLEKTFGKNVTTRNWNTVLKLA